MCENWRIGCQMYKKTSKFVVVVVKKVVCLSHIHTTPIHSIMESIVDSVTLPFEEWRQTIANESVGIVISTMNSIDLIVQQSSNLGIRGNYLLGTYTIFDLSKLLLLLLSFNIQHIGMAVSHLRRTLTWEEIQQHFPTWSQSKMRNSLDFYDLLKDFPRFLYASVTYTSIFTRRKDIRQYLTGNKSSDTEKYFWTVCELPNSTPVKSKKESSSSSSTEDSSLFDRAVTKNKQLNVWWNAKTGLIFQSHRQKIVIGRVVDGECRQLTSEDFDLCENLRFNVIDGNFIFDNGVDKIPNNITARSIGMPNIANLVISEENAEVIISLFLLCCYNIVLIFMIVFFVRHPLLSL